VPEFIIDAWRGSIPGLNDLQQRAINEFSILKGANLVVTAPTSSGKTMIGELAAVRSFVERKRSLFLLPLRALVSDKYDEFGLKYGSLGIRIIRATGEVHDDIPNLLRGRYDLCLMTYEKAAALLLAYPHVLRGVGTIVVDEVQMLADASRGANLEFLLTLLRYRRQEGLRPQIVLLSAVIGDANGLERWIAGRLLRSELRPVPLREGVLRGDGAFRYLDSDGTEKVEPFTQREPRKGSAQDLVIPLVRKLVSEDERVIVFRVEKSTTRSVAAYLASDLTLPAALGAIEALPKGDPSASSESLVECLRHGVAFHNADLTREERSVVERSFRERAGGVPVLVATTTIAMGVNTPASTVVIVGLEHPGGEPYSVAEYKNMVGRAGRLGFSEAGKSMIVCLSAAEEYRMWTTFVQGRPEALQSRFLSADPHLLITRVLAAADKATVPEMTEDQIIGFITSSFGAFQLTQRAGARPVTKEGLARAFASLRAADLIRQEGAGFRLTDLGRLAGEGGVEVESIIRLARALQGVSLRMLTEAALLATTQITLELDGIVFPVHRRSTQERDRWQRNLRAAGLPPALLSAILQGDEGTVRAKRTAAVLMWVRGVDLREIERELLQHMRGDDAAGAIRSAADRTRDLLPTVVRVAEIVNGLSDERLATTTESLLLRLELGLPDNLVTVARLVGARLTRGAYLALSRAGLTTEEAVGRAEDSELERILGNKSAVSVLRKALVAG
jgi:replicative superfamily II helicase